MATRKAKTNTGILRLRPFGKLRGYAQDDGEKRRGTTCPPPCIRWLLAEGDDGFAAVVVVEGDLAVGHGADVGAGVGGDEGGLVGVGEAEEPVQAVHLFGQADGAGVLDDRERHRLVVGWVVVFQQHVAGPVDVDLRAVFVDAVARDAAQRVSDVEALAVDHREDDQDNDDGGDEFFHG